jgi:type IV pilus assembly protein PilE
MRSASGFTLIELLITVVILGIIAAIALPSYTSYLTRSKLIEAHAMLADLRVKQEQRFQDARSYSAALCAPTGASAAQVKYFDFSCPAAPTATTFTVQAMGKAGTELAGITFTINENNARTTVVTGGSSMANKGYVSGNCWVTKKGNQC